MILILRRIVIGVVEGDTHDIGKNLVKIMLESSGFEVHDLGRDVPLRRFIEEAERQKAPSPSHLPIRSEQMVMHPMPLPR